MKRYLSALFALALVFVTQTAAFAGMAYAPNNYGYWGKTSSSAMPNEVVPSGVSNQINVSPTAGTVGIADNPTIPGTAGMVIPSGTTAQRGSTEGQIRYNTDDDKLEYRDASGWIQPGTGGGGGSGAPVGSTCEGRLTLESGVAVSTSDQLAKTTVYFTPYYGNHISLIESGAPVDHTFSELSLSASGWTADIPRDIWGRDSDGNSTMDELTSTAWSNATSRSTAIEYIAGVPVKDGGSSENAYRLLGTVLPSASGQVEDSTKYRGVCQAAPQCRVPRILRAVDTTDTWSYSSASWRSFNNSTTLGVGKIRYVASLPDTRLSVSVSARSSVGNPGGVGIDSTSTNSALITSPPNSFGTATSFYEGMPGIGLHDVYPLEYGAGSGTQYGDGGTVMQTGLVGHGVM